MRKIIIVPFVIALALGCSAPDGMRVLNEHEEGMLDIAIYAWDQTYPEHQVSDGCYNRSRGTGIYYADRVEFDSIYCGAQRMAGYSGFMCRQWIEWEYGIVILEELDQITDPGPSGYLVQECVIIHEFLHVLQNCEGLGGTFSEKSANHEGQHWQAMIDVVGCSFTGV